MAGTCMVKLACGNWQRVSDELVDLELATGGQEFGMGAAREHLCSVHGLSETVVDRSFWEWHVFCPECRYNSWHGVDAEKARSDYARHENLTGHKLRVGWDQFLGKLDDETGQGSLFVTDDDNEKRKRAEETRRELVKRRAQQRARKSREGTTTGSSWSPSRTGQRVTFEELMQRARDGARKTRDT